MTPTNPAAPPAGSAQASEEAKNLAAHIIGEVRHGTAQVPSIGQVAKLIDALAQARVDAATLAHMNSTQRIDGHLLRFAEARQMRDDMWAGGNFSWAGWIIAYIESLNVKYQELDAATRELRQALDNLRRQIRQYDDYMDDWGHGGRWDFDTTEADAALERTAAK